MWNNKKYFRIVKSLMMFQLFIILQNEYLYANTMKLYFTNSISAADKSIYIANSISAADKSVYFAHSISAADISYYITRNRSVADKEILITENISNSDLSIYIANSISAADKSIYFAHSISSADKSIYLTHSISAADEVIYFNTNDVEIQKFIIALLATNIISKGDFENNKGYSNSIVPQYRSNKCSNSYDDSGVVIQEDVCGLGNAIIETDDGWYIAAEWYGGTFLYEGDIVCGKMKTYGFQDIYSPNRDSETRFYIEDYETSLSDAYDELCE